MARLARHAERLQPRAQQRSSLPVASGNTSPNVRSENPTPNRAAISAPIPWPASQARASSLRPCAST